MPSAGSLSVRLQELPNQPGSLTVVERRHSAGHLRHDPRARERPIGPEAPLACSSEQNAASHSGVHRQQPRHCHGGQLPLPWWRAHERTQARVVGMMANRPRHTNSDYEKLLREKEKLGWRIQKTSGHFKAYCPCSCLCIVIVPSTPSAQGTLTKIRTIFKRCKEGR